MGAGRPIDDQDREQVRALHTEGLSRNAIAKRISRSYATVTKVANELGLTFDRAQTAEATRVRQVDAKARRTELAERALDDADTMRRRALSATEARDARDWAHAYSIFIDRHIRLAAVDNDVQGLAAVDEWLDAMLGRP